MGNAATYTASGSAKALEIDPMMDDRLDESGVDQGPAELNLSFRLVLTVLSARRISLELGMKEQRRHGCAKSRLIEMQIV